MPKTSIADFDVTPNNNSDIGGHNIANGCDPANINDAIRTLMAYLKRDGVYKNSGEVSEVLSVAANAQDAAVIAKTDAKSTQVKLERTGANAGTGYIGADEKNAFAVLDGSLNRRFEVSQAGHILKPNHPAFLVYNPPEHSTGKLVFSTALTNNGAHYNTSNGRFTAPVTGMYEISVFTLMNAPVSSAWGYLEIWKNGVALPIRLNSGYNYARTYDSLSGTVTGIALNQGDYIELVFTGNDGADIYGGVYTQMSGQLLG